MGRPPSDLADFLPSELLDLIRDLLNDAFDKPLRATAAFGCDHEIEIKNGVGFLRTGQR